MRWQVPKMWEGGDVWIIGGGTSVPKQFGIPNEIVQSVVKGDSTPAVYSPYLSALHDKHVIGINVAYLIGDWIDIVFFGDKGFFLSHESRLARFPGLKVTCYSGADRIKWVKFLQRDTKHPKGISSNPKLISWNMNSGSAAINVAAHSGAKRIILLGFDMKLDEKSKQHWHGLYRQGGVAPLRKGRQSLPFDRHMRGFDEIAKDARRMGIEIINCSPESAIKQFRKITVKELLNAEKTS